MAGGERDGSVDAERNAVMGGDHPLEETVVGVQL